MGALSFSWRNGAEMKRFADAFARLGEGGMARVAVPALNRTGDMAKTQVIRAMPGQTGLSRKTIVRAIGKPKRATYGNLSYEMKAKGGDISLKYFAARETRKGVSAQPFGQRQVFAGAFMKAGRFPKRVEAKKLNGHVFRRTGSGRLPIEKQKSGVIIPVEMVKGETAEAFTRSVAVNLPNRIAHELRRLTGGVVG